MKNIIKKIIKTKKRIKKGLKYGWSPTPRPERNQKIFELWQKGKTFSELGKMFNLSRTRVGQIVERLKNVNKQDLTEA